MYRKRSVQKIHRSLPEGAIRMILQLDPSDTRSAVLQLLLFSGMRIGECLSLTWDRVDTENGTLLIDRQLLGMCSQAGVDFFYYTATKNGRPRQITLPPQGRQLLQILYRKERDSSTVPGGLPKQSLVFHDPDGYPLRADRIRTWFHHLLRKHGYPSYRLHDLRHTVATAAYRESRNLKGVSKLLGHADVRITANVYCDVPEHLLRALADTQQRYFAALCGEDSDANG